MRSFQRTQDFEVHGVPVATVLVLLFGGFEDLGDALPALVADDRPKAVEADLADADVIVAIDPRAEVFLRVVQMPDADALQQAEALEALEITDLQQRIAS